MTLSQSSSDMWSRNSSLVMPAQDTTTDGGREKQAYGRGGSHTNAGRAGRRRQGALCGRSPAFTCTCSSRRLAAPASDTSAGKAAWAPRGAPFSLPGPPSSRTVSRAAAPSRSQAATAAPSRARRTLTARPMPLPAPAGGRTRGRGCGRNGRGSEVSRAVSKIRATAAEAAGTPTRPERGPPQPVTRASAEPSRSGVAMAGRGRDQPAANPGAARAEPGQL